MVVTVVGRWHVPDGQQAIAIAAARHELDVRAAQPAARREAHVFQAIDDPGCCSMSPSGPIALPSNCTGVRAARRPSRPPSAPPVSTSSVSGSSSTATSPTEPISSPAPSWTPRPRLPRLFVRSCCPGGRWEVHGWPGLVHYTAFRETARTHRYIVVHGWKSEAALQGFRKATRPTAIEQFGKVGATLIHFTGRALLNRPAVTDLL